MKKVITSLLILFLIIPSISLANNHHYNEKNYNSKSRVNVSFSITHRSEIYFGSRHTINRGNRRYDYRYHRRYHNPRIRRGGYCVREVRKSRYSNHRRPNREITYYKKYRC